jgi:hypothetical protein
MFNINKTMAVHSIWVSFYNVRHNLLLKNGLIKRLRCEIKCF